MKIRFSEYDRCPGCKKKVANMAAEKMDIVVLIFGAIVCPKCGSIFMTRETREEMLAESKRKIFFPGSRQEFIKPGGGL